VAIFLAETLEPASENGLVSISMRERETALAAILAETGHKQAWLAERLNLHPSSVSRWVLGKRPIPRRYVQAIADALGIDPRRLARDVAPIRS
jgi:DNA-binding transcriptional regulator YdaS (Cro superfamily)